MLRREDLQQEYVIDSRGMVVLFPEPVNQKAEAVMKSAQMTMISHTASALSEAEFDEDILLLTMDEDKKMKIIEQ